MSELYEQPPLKRASTPVNNTDIGSAHSQSIATDTDAIMEHDRVSFCDDACVKPAILRKKLISSRYEIASDLPNPELDDASSSALIDGLANIDTGYSLADDTCMNGIDLSSIIAIADILDYGEL